MCLCQEADFFPLFRLSYDIFNVGKLLVEPQQINKLIGTLLFVLFLELL